MKNRLRKGKSPKRYVRLHGDIYECVSDEWDIDPDEPEVMETDTYVIDGGEEYYDYVTKCKACGTQFIAYDEDGLTRNYCPGCGKQLQKVFTMFNGREYITRFTGNALQILPDVMQELVRCKDCKYKGNAFECRLDSDLQEHGGHRTEDYDDWFCADGEEKK